MYVLSYTDEPPIIGLFCALYFSTTMFLWKRKPKPDLSLSVKIHVALSREQPLEITVSASALKYYHEYHLLMIMARHYDKKVSLDNVNFMTGTNDVYTIEGKHLCS